MKCWRGKNTCKLQSGDSVLLIERAVCTSIHHRPCQNTKHKTITSLIPIQETRMQSVQSYAKEHKPSTGPRPASSIPMRHGSSFQAGDAEAITMPQQHFTASCRFGNVTLLFTEADMQWPSSVCMWLNHWIAFESRQAKGDWSTLGELGSFGYGGTELSFGATKREGRGRNVYCMDDNILDGCKMLRALWFRGHLENSWRISSSVGLGITLWFWFRMDIWGVNNVKPFHWNMFEKGMK